MDASPILVLGKQREISPIVHAQDNLNHLEMRHRRVTPLDLT